MTARPALGVALALLVGAAPVRASDRGTVYETLTGEEKHTVLAVAVREAGGVGVLSGKAEHTLFAPTDAAFKNLDDATIARLAERKEAVGRLFRTHLVPGRLTTAELKKRSGQSLTATDGTQLPVDARADGLYVGGVKVLSELPCRNGVIHALDEVLPIAVDREAFQGLWQAVELEADGKKAAAEAVKAFQVQIKGDQLVFSPATDNRKHTFAIDPAAKPKALDLTPADGPAKGQKLACAIYKLDGDKLVICIDKEGEVGKRPTEFKTAAGSGLALVTLERVKEKK